MKYSTLTALLLFTAVQQHAVSSSKLSRQSILRKNSQTKQIDQDGEKGHSVLLVKKQNLRSGVRSRKNINIQTLAAAQQRDDKSSSETVEALDCTLQLSETQFEKDKMEEHQWECADDNGRLLDIDVPYTIDYKDPKAGLIESGVTILHAENVLISDHDKAIFNGEPTLIKGSSPKDHRRLLSTKGTRSILVVRVEANDASTTPSEEDLAREVFGIEDSTGATDTWNLASALDQCSYGQLTIEPAQNNGVEDGVYTVSIDVKVQGARNVDIRNVVLNKLRSDFGTTNLNALYDHFMLCMPPGTVSKQGSAGWSGYGIINGSVTMFNDSWCTKTSLQMHEIGHNLGLRHSGENGGEYADSSGMMGHSYNLDDAPVMCFNTAKNWQLGWYEDKHTTVEPLVQNFWEGDILGYADYQNPTAPSDSSVVVKVEGHNKQYFIGFNHKAGINRQNQEMDAVNKVTVHSIGTTADDSDLEAKLGVGETFEIPDFGGGIHSVLVQVVNIDMSVNPPIAKVSVNLMKCSSDLDCNDGSTCTTDTCNISTGACHHEPNNLCSTFMKMVLLTDRYPSETSWQIVDNCNKDSIVMSRDKYEDPFTTYEDSTNLPLSQYTIKMNDAYGDGICCGQGNGSFQVMFNDEVVASGGQFGRSEIQTWGSCDLTSDDDLETSAPTASPSTSPTKPPTTAPTVCEIPYELRFKAGSSSSSGGAFWEFAYDENRSRILASSSGVSYTPGSLHIERGCLPKNCYIFQMKGKVDSYLLSIDGKEVAGTNEGGRETEISLFGKCAKIQM